MQVAGRLPSRGRGAARRGYRQEKGRQDYLVNEFFDDEYDFKITGAYKEDKKSQLNYFRLELLRRTGKDMANFITSLRILLSAGLLFCPVLSPVFYVLYLSAGLTDMVDGLVARMTHTESEFGSKLDTAADFVFVVVCLIKLLPTLHLPTWQYIWVAIIAAMKLINVLIGYITQKKFVAVHSVINKIVGVALFIFPLTLSIIDPAFSAFALCLIATSAALQEAYLIKKEAENDYLIKR